MEISVNLDRSSEPWVGTFPGLGSVRVHKDGSIDIDVLPDDGYEPESNELREAALRYGWGEPLSLARLGFACLGGTAVVPPDPNLGALLIVGDVHDCAVVMVELVRLGWAVLGDRLVPIQWRGDVLIAHPRVAPVLVSSQRAAAAELAGERARAHSDALSVGVARMEVPRPVRAVVVAAIRRPDEEALRVLSGRERFDTAGQLAVGGVFAADEQSGATVMAEHVRLAAFPCARLHFRKNELQDDIAALVDWWESTPLPPLKVDG